MVRWEQLVDRFVFISHFSSTYILKVLMFGRIAASFGRNWLINGDMRDGGTLVNQFVFVSHLNDRLYVKNVLIG